MTVLINLIKSPYSIILLCVVLILISKFIFKIDYMNCGKIIHNHNTIFKNKNGKLLVIPFATYNVLPLLVALGINNIRVIDDAMINIIIIILSILTSMLFTLLVMIIDMKGKIDGRESKDANQANVIKKLLKETYHTLMFEILISISVLLLAFIYLFTVKINFIISIIIYYLVFLLVFNLFIVLKRIFNIIEKDLST